MMNSLAVSGLLEHILVGRVAERETVTLSVSNLQERILQLALSLEET